MDRYTLLELNTISDERGSLTVLENVLPFPVARCYWVYDADGQTRGGHRHHVTRQALVAIAGTISVYMDDGVEQATVELDNPGFCLLVEPKDWHTLTFGPGAILLVAASHPYDRNDYIEQGYE